MNCIICRTEYEVEQTDRDFCTRIGVPTANKCRSCRLANRMILRNERTFYRRKCDVPGHAEELISIYSPDKPILVYDEKYWWSDAWDPMSFGSDFDPKRPFFEQYGELLKRMPMIERSLTNTSNCSYCNQAEGDKDCYFISASKDDENVMYSNRLVATKDSMDLYMSSDDQLCYDLVNCHQCYNLRYSRDCTSCNDSSFLYDCVGCSNCFGCTNLRNKSYCFFNEQLSKDEYKEKISKLDLGDYEVVVELKKKFFTFEKQGMHRFAHLVRCVNSTGDNVFEAKNAYHCFDMIWSPSAEDSRHVVWGGAGAKDCQDGGPGLGAGLELAYEVADSGIGSNSLFFTYIVYGSHNVRYSMNCHGCSDIFGCYGLRQKQYCILNRQYSKEGYEELLPKLIKQMKEIPFVDSLGRKFGYGEFFPTDILPFAYNETIAQEYFPLTKEEALKRGYKWKDPEAKQYTTTKRSEDLPTNISDAGDELLSETISCSHAGKCEHQCSTAFRLIPNELDFYSKMNIPLPRLCSNCRHYERLAQRNPMKLWKRACSCAGTASDNATYQNHSPHAHGSTHCSVEFETTYDPARPEIVYCESCYNSEVA